MPSSSSIPPGVSASLRSAPSNRAQGVVARQNSSRSMAPPAYRAPKDLSKIPAPSAVQRYRNLAGVQQVRPAHFDAPVNRPSSNLPAGAPPVYRPQPLRVTAQTGSVQTKSGVKKAPPAYRPLEQGRTAQPARTYAGVRPPVAGNLASPAFRGLSGASGAPPVYRPQPPRAGVQAKSAPGQGGSKAPPVYRPIQQGRTAQPAGLNAGRGPFLTNPSRLRSAAPPVYRPGAAGIPLQTKKGSLQAQPNGCARPGSAPAMGNAGTATAQGLGSHPQTRVTPRLPDGTIQPLMGMELELPIVVLTDQEDKLVLKVPFLRGNDFKVEADHSHRFGEAITNGKGNIKDPTIVEIVMDPFDEHRDDAEDGIWFFKDDVQKFIAGVERLTQNRTRPATVGELALELGLRVENGAKDYLIGVPSTKPAADPDKALVHFTIGIGQSRIGEASKWIRDNSRENEASKLVQTLSTSFREALTGFMAQSGLSEQHQTLALNFYFMAYNNAKALDVWKSGKFDNLGVRKNYTYMLSRVAFTSVLASLPGPVKTFIRDCADQMILAIYKDFETKEGLEYFGEILKGKAKAQSAYFGGMKELGTEMVGPPGHKEVGIPMELRAIGTSRQSTEEWSQNAEKLIRASKAQFAPPLRLPDFPDLPPVDFGPPLPPGLGLPPPPPPRLVQPPPNNLGNQGPPPIVNLPDLW
ncbi:hypothetical protein [Edaphobacter modestus]|uniref:Uncharacterized protein n=1 Tax=Edaphobacter modestus TaxID=388466 RepID=A0A4Q7Y0E2_9BACT|nr:hypothetical protein [Edaphobacter modestus]RZU29744.1 hypothetical protein BDD14_6361 [Edaphobacter modestus]